MIDLPDSDVVTGRRIQIDALNYCLCWSQETLINTVIFDSDDKEGLRFAS